MRLLTGIELVLSISCGAFQAVVIDFSAWRDLHNNTMNACRANKVFDPFFLGMESRLMWNSVFSDEQDLLNSSCCHSSCLDIFMPE